MNYWNTLIWQLLSLSAKFECVKYWYFSMNLTSCMWSMRGWRERNASCTSPRFLATCASSNLVSQAASGGREGSNSFAPATAHSHPTPPLVPSSRLNSLLVSWKMACVIEIYRYRVQDFFSLSIFLITEIGFPQLWKIVPGISISVPESTVNPTTR